MHYLCVIIKKISVTIKLCLEKLHKLIYPQLLPIYFSILFEKFFLIKANINIHIHRIFDNHILKRPALVTALPGFDTWLNIYFAAEDEGRTEPATPRRKEKEREKGRVPKSQEIPSALVTMGVLIVLFFLAGWMITGLTDMIHKYVGNFTDLPQFSEAVLLTLLISIVKDTAVIMAPVFLIAFVMAIIGNLAQVGFLFSLKPLAFDFSKIKLDPASIIKKVLISRQVIVNLVKTIIKVMFLGTISYLIIESDFLLVMKTSDLSLKESLKILGFIVFKLAFITTLTLLIIGIPDYFYQRYEFLESIKMTREETKQELKETEGDPLIKQRQRQRAIEVMRKRMMSEVQNADVVITNPTHYAVAMRYNPEFENAPRLLAKGADHAAFIIRNIAKNKEIPIVENKPLARELYDNVSEGELVPEEFYRVLVEIFMNLENIKERLAV
ncbi:MAG: flagellar biosynthesis protein FlhB [Spirochaetia bacterium]|nr:flagellar biosynthesis protein FlhB [Spirochaetia bacterium]